MSHNRISYSPGQLIKGIRFLTMVPNVGRHRRGKFKCPHCGGAFEARISHVTGGNIISCGCIFKGKKKHGATSSNGYRSEEYKSWYCMIRRCIDESHHSYKRYGGAGIKVAERWKDFNNFLVDMGLRPSPSHTLDRYPNKSGNYEPGNVRWATHKQQSRNLKNNLTVTYKNQTKTLVEWCEELNLKYPRTRERIFKKGMSPNEAFSLPKRYDRIAV